MLPWLQDESGDAVDGGSTVGSALEPWLFLTISNLQRKWMDANRISPFRAADFS
jgi:hypothetical protein